jgi:hypothetical protein
MLPTVSKVVFVAHPQLGAVLGDQIADSQAAVVDRAKVIQVIHHEPAIGVPAACNLKLVQMRIRPAHRGLNQRVQLLQRHVLGLNPPPDRRIRVLQDDFETIDGAEPCRRLLSGAARCRTGQVHSQTVREMRLPFHFGIPSSRPESQWTGERPAAVE